MLSFLANYTLLLGVLYPYCAYLNCIGKPMIRANDCHSTRAIDHVPSHGACSDLDPIDS